MGPSQCLRPGRIGEQLAVDPYRTPPPNVPVMESVTSPVLPLTVSEKAFVDIERILKQMGIEQMPPWATMLIAQIRKLHG